MSRGVFRRSPYCIKTRRAKKKTKKSGTSVRKKPFEIEKKRTRNISFRKTEKPSAERATRDDRRRDRRRRERLTIRRTRFRRRPRPT